MPRTAKISATEFVDIVRTHENIIFQDETTSAVCVGPTHKVWDQIAFQLGNKISSKSAYTWLKCNRNEVMKLLNRTTCISTTSHCNENETYAYSTVNDRDEHSDEEELPSTRFVLSVSSGDWAKMSVAEVRYREKPTGRRYLILLPGWTAVFHEYFWKETKFPCSIAYKRAKVYNDGLNFCVISGVCTCCGSKLTAVLQNKPMPDDSILPFRCKYVGHHEHCIPSKKRRMQALVKRQFVDKQIEKGLSAAAVRRGCANELMDFGDPEPPHIPTSNALRLAKSRVLREKWLADDAIVGICRLKYSSTFLNCIHDVGYDRFFCHYWTSNQMNIYREYVKSTEYAIVCIDATGGLVRKPTLTAGRKTKEILLYNIVINDKLSKVQLSVGCMLSERHDNNSIGHWLVEWLRSGAPCPKEVVTDMSLALMSGVVRAFTQHSTLWGYIQFCFEILQREREVTPANMPCMIRCDVAHVIKLITTWKAFHSKDSRIKEFIIRVLGQVLLSEEMNDVKQLLEHLFFLLYSKTDGKNTSDESETLAEKGRQFLNRRISTGEKPQFLINAIEIYGNREVRTEDSISQTDSDDEFPIVNDASDAISLTQRNKENPFFMMVYEISQKCQRRAQREEGDHDNLYWAPSVVPRIVDLCAYLPLWSSIMCPVVGYGSNPPSSAPVESDFSDLKNRVLLKHKLPMRVDDFLQTHLKSMDGTTKLTYAAMMNTPNSVEVNRSQPLLNDEEVGSNDASESAPITATECPCCSNGDLPSGAHKCIKCRRSVHVIEGCSFSVGDDEGYGEQRVCIFCQSKGGDKNWMFESQSVENWRNINSSNASKRRAHLSTSSSEGLLVKRQKNIHTSDRKKPALYLTPKPELLHRNPHSRVKKKIIGLIRNGNLPVFKTKKLKTGNFTFSNTCAFDSVIQVLAVAYCDSEEYCTFVLRKEKEYVLWELIKNLLKDGVNVQTYTKRAAILSELYVGKPLTSNLTYISVEESVDELLLKLLKRYPSATLETDCITCNKKNSQEKVMFSPLVTVCPTEINTGYLQNLLRDIVEDFCKSSGHCKGTRNKQCKINRDVKVGPHLIFNLINCIENEESDIGNEIPMRLNCIPSVLKIRNEEYHLRGCASTTEYQQSIRAIVTTSSLRALSSIGHYKSYTYREPSKVWQLYDDQKEKGIHVKSNTTIFPQVLFYSK